MRHVEYVVADCHTVVGWEWREVVEDESHDVRDRGREPGGDVEHKFKLIYLRSETVTERWKMEKKNS